MHEKHYPLLIYILEKAGVHGKLRTSTIKVAKALDSTQQTVSRKLIEMERLKLIKRRVGLAGITLQLDTAGIEILRKNYHKLKRSFETRVRSIKGELRTGLGEGRYYVSLPGYWKQFKKKLGFKPYFGTLNLFVKDYERLLQFMDELEEIYINGFKTSKRTYGSLKAYKVKIKDIKGAIVVPERSRYGKEIIELIAPFNLTKKLKLKVGDKVVITC